MTRSDPLTGVERLERYVDDVLAGRVVACEKVRAACQRHRDDIERSRDPEWPYRFDPRFAERPIAFMERFLKPTKGDYDRMRLMDWQCFVEGSIFGWVDKHTGMRRFREALIVVGRGNGKSTLMSGNASFLCSKDHERGADVYLLANTKEQAGIVFQECSAQIMGSPVLAPHFRVLRDGIHFDSENAKIMHRASDSQKLDGLNPHGAIFDEIHAYRDFKLINVIRRGMNKRRQPLALYITTMGTVLDGPLMYFYGLFTDAMTGALPQETADRMFSFIAEMDKEDDIDDSSLWVKANPGIGSILDLEKLRSDWGRAKQIPQERSDFINKQLNIFTNASEASFVEWEIIQRNMQEISPEELLGRSCYGGFDLSQTEDFTAAALEFPLDDGRVAVIQHTWIPRKKVEADNEHIPYYEWAMAGHLTIVDGEYIKQEDVYDWFRAMREKYEIVSIGFDPANAMWLVRMLEGNGFNCSVVRQGPLTLNGPMKDIRENLLDGRIAQTGNPMFNWYLANVKLRNDFFDKEKENWMPTKRERFRKIDGFMAWLDAHTEYMRLNPLDNVEQPEIGFSVYEL